MTVAASGGHSEHLQQVGSSPSLHPRLITNEPALFRATNELLTNTLLRTLRNVGLSWLKQLRLSFSDIFQPNLVITCMFNCLTAVHTFIQKYARISTFMQKFAHIAKI